MVYGLPQVRHHAKFDFELQLLNCDVRDTSPYPPKLTVTVDIPERQPHAITGREQSQQTSTRYWINFAHTAKYKAKPHTTAIDTSPIDIAPQFRFCP